MAAMDVPNEESEYLCPLCMEEMDLTDRKFQPCKCGYQICLWCWHQIMELSNNAQPGGRCPACRTPYDKDKIISAAPKSLDLNGGFSEKKGKSNKGKFKTAEGRKHLSNVRVVRRNLVYAVGLPLHLADESVLERKEYFGQYGKILKISVSRGSTQSSPHPTYGSTASVYVTFVKEDDAFRCIQSIDGCMLEGKIVRGCFGTTKYCNSWIKNVPCTNPDCLYLHESGMQEDSYTKEEMLSKCGRYQMFNQLSHPPIQYLGPGLPPPPPLVDSYTKTESVSLQKRIPSQSQLNSNNNNGNNSISISPVKTSNSSSNVSAWGNSLPLSAAWGSKSSTSKDEVIPSSKTSSASESISSKLTVNAKTSKTTGFTLTPSSAVTTTPNLKPTDTESISSKMFNQSERSISKPNSFEPPLNQTSLKAFSETQTSRVKWSALALSLKSSNASSNENGLADVDDLDHPHVSSSKASRHMEESHSRQALKSSKPSNSSMSNSQQQFTNIDYFNDDGDRDGDDEDIKRASDAFESSDGSNLPESSLKSFHSVKSKNVSVDVHAVPDKFDNSNRNCLDKEDEDFLRSLLTAAETSPSVEPSPDEKLALNTEESSSSLLYSSKPTVDHSKENHSNVVIEKVLSESIPSEKHEELPMDELTSLPKEDITVRSKEETSRKETLENEKPMNDDDTFRFSRHQNAIMSENHLIKESKDGFLMNGPSLSTSSHPTDGNFALDPYSASQSSMELNENRKKNTPSSNDSTLSAYQIHPSLSFANTFDVTEKRMALNNPVSFSITAADAKDMRTVSSTIPPAFGNDPSRSSKSQDFSFLVDSTASIDPVLEMSSSRRHHTNHHRTPFVDSDDTVIPKKSDEDVIKSILDLDLDFVSDIPLPDSKGMVDLLHLQRNDEKIRTANQNMRRNSRFRFAQESELDAMDNGFNCMNLQPMMDTSMHHPLHPQHHGMGGKGGGSAAAFSPFSDSLSNENLFSNPPMDSLYPILSSNHNAVIPMAHEIGNQPVMKSIAKISAPPGFSAPSEHPAISRLSAPPGFSAPPGLSAPPGFTAPPGFSTPPGFSAPPKPPGFTASSLSMEENRKDPAPEEKILAMEKLVPKPSARLGESSDLELEFMDPAIMAVGKSSIPLPNGHADSSSQPRAAAVSSFFGPLFHSNDRGMTHVVPPYMAPPIPPTQPLSRPPSQYPEPSFLMHPSHLMHPTHRMMESIERKENANHLSENGYSFPANPLYFRTEIEGVPKPRDWAKPSPSDSVLSSDAHASGFDISHGFSNPHGPHYPASLHKFSSPAFPVPTPQEGMASGSMNARIGFSVSSSSPYPSLLHGLTSNVANSTFDLAQRMQVGGERYAPSPSQQHPSLLPKSFSPTPLLHALHASSFHNFDRDMNGSVIRNVESLNESVLLSVDKRSESIS